jgi:acetyltransferase-like isoleucine patch superfamily enzyme
MRRLLSRLISRVLLHVGVRLDSLQQEIAARTLPKFGNDPKNLRFAKPRTIFNPQHMHLGADIIIGPGSVLKTVTAYPETPSEVKRIGSGVQTFEPNLVIGNRVTATGALQISALDSIIIDDDVMFAANVFICDGFHGYESTAIPYKDQPMTKVAPIRIGKGCWVGQNVIVMPGVVIGEMSIIGANSVITKSIPPRSIAVGSPARVIKRWSEVGNEWVVVAKHPRPHGDAE